MNAQPATKPLNTDPQSIFKPRYDNFIGGKWVAPKGG